jgi:hypothetical protein
MTGVGATILSSDSAISTANGGYVRVNEPFVGPVKLSISSDYQLNITTVSEIFVGLSQDSSGSIAFKYGIGLDYIGYVITDNNATVASDNAYTVTPDTVASIIYDGTTVKYYIDGTLKYTSTILPTGPLYAYVRMFGINGKFKNFHADQLLLGPGPNTTLITSPALPSLDYSKSSTFHIIPSASTFPINVINVPISKSCITIQLILDQLAASVTPGYANVVTVNGSTVNPLLKTPSTITVGSSVDLETIVLYSTDSSGNWSGLINYTTYS